VQAEPNLLPGFDPGEAGGDTFPDVEGLVALLAGHGATVALKRLVCNTANAMGDVQNVQQDVRQN
jgi:hypothetical protein